MASAPSWDWFDGRRWIAFDAASAAQLDGAFLAGPGGGGQGTLSLTFGSHRYALNVQHMQQQNTQTGYMRPIRRTTALGGGGGGGGGGGAWEWKDDRAWVPYDAASAGQLSAALAAHWPSTVLHATTPKGFASYTVDFALQQQTNQRTGFPRQIRNNTAGGAAGGGGGGGVVPKGRVVWPARRARRRAQGDSAGIIHGEARVSVLSVFCDCCRLEVFFQLVVSQLLMF